jgi:hypothetical protein
MWLPSDERRLLLGYYVNMFNIDDRNVCRYLDNPKWFEMPDWFCVLEVPRCIPILTPWLVKQRALKVKPYGDGNKTSTKEDKSLKETQKELKTHIKLERRLRISNDGLGKRKLITIKPHQHCSDVAGLALTIDGYDLARKYSCWWTRTGLWFAEYKDHWFWLILSFLGGVVGASIVNWLSK